MELAAEQIGVDILRVSRNSSISQSNGFIGFAGRERFASLLQQFRWFIGARP
jgi:hypothetical protein